MLSHTVRPPWLRLRSTPCTSLSGHVHESMAENKREISVSTFQTITTVFLYMVYIGAVE